MTDNEVFNEIMARNFGNEIQREKIGAASGVFLAVAIGVVLWVIGIGIVVAAIML